MQFLMNIAWTMVCIKLGVSGLPVPDNSLNNWSNADNEEIQPHKHIYSLPTNLAGNLKSINVSGKTNSTKQRLIFSLVTKHKESKTPDFKNIACQLHANFEAKNITVSSVKDGEESPAHEAQEPDDLFQDNNFSILFVVDNKNKAIELIVKGSFIESICKINHDTSDIHFLALGGDIEKVEQIIFSFD